MVGPLDRPDKHTIIVSYNNIDPERVAETEPDSPLATAQLSKPQPLDN
jgi:hypothetical protein